MRRTPPTPRHSSKFVAVSIALLSVTLTASALPRSAFANTGPDPESVYLVQLTDAPLATYGGGVAGIPATRPAPGTRLTSNSAAYTAYREHLRARRAGVLAGAGLAPRHSIREFDTVFDGFAARLTGAEAARLRGIPGVAAVRRNRIKHADTVVTPGIMGLDGATGVWRQRFGDPARAGEGVIVGIIDTGFNPDSPSLAALPDPRPDQAVIDAKWHGVCDAGEQQPVRCNNKVIGARWYDLTGQAVVVPGEFRSPRDFDGHGTEVASVAAGKHNAPAVTLGLRVGEISGVAPAARIAVYKSQWARPGAGPFGFEADILAAIEDATDDGVDVLNASLGDGNDTFDPTDEALLNAAAAGVFVAVSAGNDGPGAATLDHANPWTTTVAAGTHDIGFTRSVRLGNGTTISGPGMGPAVAATGLVDAAKAGAAGATAAEAEQCFVGKLDPAKVTGKIALCAAGGNRRVEKGFAVKQAGGVGMVLSNPATVPPVADYQFVPTVDVGPADGAAIRSYIGGTASPTASLAAAVMNTSQRAPAIAGSSSRGPGRSTNGDLIKPDITAPGVGVLAAGVPRLGLPGDTAFPVTGTSFASPQIAGVAALLKAKNPTWSPMAVKSAIMTTSTTKDNTGQPIPGAGGAATPFEMGAGSVRPASMFDPGLVYTSEPNEWRRFACGTGQPVPFCASSGSMEPSDLNYPSIASGDVPGVQTIMRRVTNVTNVAATYTAGVQAPPGFAVTVTPSTLSVPARGLASFTVKLTRTTAPFGKWAFGALTWTDSAGHAVRSPIAVRPAAVVAPAEVVHTGTSGAPSVPLRAGFTGTLTAKAYGLVAPTVTSHPVQGITTEFDENAPTTGPGVVTTTVQVPAGTRLARFATRAADYAAGEDLDIFVYDAAGKLVGLSATETTDETVTLAVPAAGTYQVYLVQFAAPPGAPNQTVRLHRHVIGSAPGSLTRTPTDRPVTAGQSYTVTLGWNGLATGVKYLGVLEYLNGTTVLDRTVVRVNT